MNYFKALQPCLTVRTEIVVQKIAEGRIAYSAGATKGINALHRDVVLALLERASPEHIVVPRAGGRPASPVFFPARFRAELLQRRGDEGGRGVRDAHPEACLQVEMPDPRILADIDTPEQYEALLREEQPRE